VGQWGAGTFINLFTSNVIIVRTPVRPCIAPPNDPQRVHPNHHVICTPPPLFQRHPPSSRVSHAFHLVLSAGSSARHPGPPADFTNDGRHDPIWLIVIGLGHPQRHRARWPLYRRLMREEGGSAPADPHHRSLVG
jgi:hypothetical protein